MRASICNYVENGLILQRPRCNGSDTSTKTQKTLAHFVRGAFAEETHVTDEKYFGMATAETGGPACVLLLVEPLVDTGVRIGLPRDITQESVLQTILRSTRTIEKTGRHGAGLGNVVASLRDNKLFS